MHDDRRLVEGRIDRVLHERIAPAVYCATVPMRLRGWRVPGEPVSIREAERQPTSRSRSVTLGAHPGRRCGSGPKASSRRNGSGAASRRCSTLVSLVTGLDSKPKRSCTTPQGARSRAFTQRADTCPSCRRQPAASRSGSSWRLLRTPMSSHKDSFPPRSVTG